MHVSQLHGPDARLPGGQSTHFNGQFVPGVRRTALYFLVFLTQCILRSVCSKL